MSAGRVPNLRCNKRLSIQRHFHLRALKWLRQVQLGEATDVGIAIVEVFEFIGGQEWVCHGLRKWSVWVLGIFIILFYSHSPLGEGSAPLFLASSEILREYGFFDSWFDRNQLFDDLFKLFIGVFMTILQLLELTNECLTSLLQDAKSQMLEKDLEAKDSFYLLHSVVGNSTLFCENID